MILIFMLMMTTVMLNQGDHSIPVTVNFYYGED